MNELIPVTLHQIDDNELVQAVSAIDLHAYLEIGRDMPTWFNARRKKLGLISGVSYVLAETSPVRGEFKSKTGPAPRDYYITLDVAKHLCMLEQNEKGHKARQYFIDVEKEYRSGKASHDWSFKETLSRAVLMASEHIKQLESGIAERDQTIEQQGEKIAQLKPDADAFDRLTRADGTHNLTETAKLLGQNPKAFNQDIHKKEFIYRFKGNLEWLPYQCHINNGNMVLRMTETTDVHGNKTPRRQALFTNKGLGVLCKVYGVQIGPDLFSIMDFKSSKKPN